MGREPGVTPMVTAPAPIPLPGVCHSQVASWLTPQLSVLLPVLLTVKVWAGGLLLPWTAVNARLVGLAADGRWDRCRRDGEGDGDRDGRNPGASAEDDGAGMGARGQGAGSRLQSHGAIAGASAGAEGQPAGVLACGPVEGAAAGVADTERLRGGVTAPLNGGEREARGTGADGRWHGCRRDGEGDGDRDGSNPGASAEDDGAGMGARG